MISTWLTGAVVAANVALCGIVLAGIAYAASAERRASVAGGAPFALAAVAVVAWGALVLALAHEGVFESTSETTTPIIAFGIVTPVVAGVGLLRVAAVRRTIERIPLHWLVGVQLYRVVGGLFLVAYAQDEMPGEFALPAGIGDILVGVTAVGVAYLLATRSAERARTATLAWCALGIGDLLLAAGTGFLSAPSTFQQLALDAPNAAITSYPFVLIPTFAVPLSIVLHVYVIARLARGRKPLGAPAARAAGIERPTGRCHIDPLPDDVRARH